MPFCRHFYRTERIGALTAILIAFSSPALAGEPIGVGSYADSYGNLVIRDPAGFKRILVGKGHLAEEYTRREGVKVVYLEENRGRLYLRKQGKCRYGALLRGRSHMYGLPDNVVPVPTVTCR
jgi:hypothetical protein|uniref:Uncharacterized protein n=1 Tax=Chelativorans sp. (strain BNC1) TaxID=266779 RepID=Q11DA4_CHESB